MSIIARLLGRKKSPDEGIYFYVRCDNCGRVLHTRLDRQRDLTRTDEGFKIRKEMMDDRCFRPIYLEASFDRSYNVTGMEMAGGTLIDRETWEAEKNLPRRPQTPAGTETES